LKWAPRAPRRKHNTLFLNIYRINEIYFKISFAYQGPQLHFIHVCLDDASCLCSIDCLITLRLYSTNILLVLAEELIYIFIYVSLVDVSFMFHIPIFASYGFHLRFCYSLLTSFTLQLTLYWYSRFIFHKDVLQWIAYSLCLP